MSDIAKEKMEKVQQALNDYERSLGLLHTNNVDEAEINGYFNMNRDDIEKLSAFDAIGIALRLNQLAFFMQRNHNAEQSRLAWTTNEINSYCCDKLDQFSNSYYNYETKVGILSKQDSYLEKLVQIKNYAQLRVQRLEYLSSGINNLAATFSSVSKLKITMRDK